MIGIKWIALHCWSYTLILGNIVIWAYLWACSVDAGAMAIVFLRIRGNDPHESDKKKMYEFYWVDLKYCFNYYMYIATFLSSITLVLAPLCNFENIGYVISATGGVRGFLYSTGVPFVSCTLSVTLWEYIWNIYIDKKIRYCLSAHGRLGRNVFSLPTCWLQKAFWRPGWSVIPNMALRYSLIFKMAMILPLNCKFAS